MCNSIKIEALINSLSKEIAELEEKLKVLENEKAGRRFFKYLLKDYFFVGEMPWIYV